MNLIKKACSRKPWQRWALSVALILTVSFQSYAMLHKMSRVATRSINPTLFFRGQAARPMVRAFSQGALPKVTQTARRSVFSNAALYAGAAAICAGAQIAKAEGNENFNVVRIPIVTFNTDGTVNINDQVAASQKIKSPSFIVNVGSGAALGGLIAVGGVAKADKIANPQEAISISGAIVGIGALIGGIVFGVRYHAYKKTKGLNLFSAAAQGEIGALKKLIEYHEINPYDADCNGVMPLMVAARVNSKESCNYLTFAMAKYRKDHQQGGSDQDGIYGDLYNPKRMRDIYGNTVLDHALAGGHKELADHLKSQGFISGKNK